MSPKNVLRDPLPSRAHIGVEEEVKEKRGSVGPARPRGTSCPQSMRVHESKIEEPLAKQPPYEPMKPQARARTREGAPTKHNF